MAKHRKTAEAERAVVRFFDQLPTRVFKPGQLAGILSQNAARWQLPYRLQVTTSFIEFLKETKLREVNLISEHLRGATRYVWGDFTPPFELALTIGKKPYLSHATAVYIHGLTDQIPKTIYINDEQSEKHFGPASLTQEAIDRAFARPPRTSRAVYTVDQLRFVVISGKFTGHLEVGQSATDDGIVADVTKLERTLIDIAVRPEYAGGPYSVLEAYKAAKDKISLNVLTATLKKLGHAYPYHQVIGFYLQKAGYDPAKLEPLKRLGMQFKFYLTHGMDGSDLDSDWQLHIPKGF